MTMLAPQKEGIPLPQPTDLSKPFWDGCAAGELRFQRCRNCKKAVFIPAVMCRYCGSLELDWEKSSGKGRVYSWSIVWRPQTPAFTVPYAPAIVDVAEGYQMLTDLIGIEPDQIKAGMPVEVEFHPVGGEIHLPYFRPAKTGT
jgi:uncharacterized OB-fold protein